MPLASYALEIKHERGYGVVAVHLISQFASSTKRSHKLNPMNKIVLFLFNVATDYFSLTFSKIGFVYKNRPTNGQTKNLRFASSTPISHGLNPVKTMVLFLFNFATGSFSLTFGKT